MCATGELDGMYGFTGVNTRFGGANACYHPLRPHSDFEGGVMDKKDPLSPVSLKDPPTHKKQHTKLIGMFRHNFGRDLVEEESCGKFIIV